MVTAKVCMALFYPQGYLAILVVDMVHRHHGRVGLLVAALLWKLAWCILVSWKLVLCEETFRSVPV